MVTHNAAVAVQEGISGVFSHVVGAGVGIFRAGDYASAAFANNRKRHINAQDSKNGSPFSVRVHNRADIGALAVYRDVHIPFTGWFAPGYINGFIYVGDKTLPTAGILQILLETPARAARNVNQPGFQVPHARVAGFAGRGIAAQVKESGAPSDFFLEENLVIIIVDVVIDVGGVFNSFGDQLSHPGIYGQRFSKQAGMRDFPCHRFYPGEIIDGVVNVGANRQ